jgi:hypothetical protein
MIATYTNNHALQIKAFQGLQIDVWIKLFSTHLEIWHQLMILTLDHIFLIGCHDMTYFSLITSEQSEASEAKSYTDY